MALAVITCWRATAVAQMQQVHARVSQLDHSGSEAPRARVRERTSTGLRSRPLRSLFTTACRVACVCHRRYRRAPEPMPHPLPIGDLAVVAHGPGRAGVGIVIPQPMRSAARARWADALDPSTLPRAHETRNGRYRNSIGASASPVDITAVPNRNDAHEMLLLVVLVDDPVRPPPGRVTAFVLEHQRLPEPSRVLGYRVQRLQDRCSHGDREAVKLPSCRRHHLDPPERVVH